MWPYKTYTWIFIAVHLLKSGKTSNIHHLMNVRVHMIYSLPMEYYLVIKRNKIVVQVTAWMNLKNINVRERSQLKKTAYWTVESPNNVYQDWNQITSHTSIYSHCSVIFFNTLHLLFLFCLFASLFFFSLIHPSPILLKHFISWVTVKFIPSPFLLPLLFRSLCFSEILHSFPNLASWPLLSGPIQIDNSSRDFLKLYVQLRQSSAWTLRSYIWHCQGEGHACQHGLVTE